jgi:uncharacterized protein (TIGR02001 family)
MIVPQAQFGYYRKMKVFNLNQFSCLWSMLGFAACSPAFAQTAQAPPYTLSSNLGVVSDYRLRGISQTSKAYALQAGVDFIHSSGLYLGGFASNVSWIKDFNGATKGALELDIYGGYKREISKNFNIDIGAATYRYPGNNSGVAGTPGATALPGQLVNANTNEVFAAFTYSWLTAKYNRSLGNFLGNANSSGSQYFELSATFDVGTGYTLTPHLGHQKVANQAAADYSDYAVNFGKDLGKGLTINLALLGTTAKKNGFYVDLNGRFIANHTAVLSLKAVF